MLDRQEILDYLQEYKAIKQKQYAIKRLGVFGSFARGEASEASDIDIVVDFEKSSMFALVAIKQDIEEYFHRHVDIVQIRERMNMLLKNRIQRDAIYV
jgi:predicted nucleotidyltransferase